uniref:Bromo domain-containing protein n=1 Tax=Corethron hystrix TaxID=216773 RepID=A0A7S1BN05_9STRA
MFRHPPSPQDFLMMFVRRNMQSANQGFERVEIDRDLLNSREGTTQVLLRHMPQNLFCVGQTEPRIKGFAPNSKGEKEFQVPFFAYQIAKRLSQLENRDGRGMKFEEIKERLFENTDILHNALRARIREVAVYDKNTQIWTQRRVGDEDYPGAEALGRRFSPEGVSLNESSASGAQRLLDLGIRELHKGSSSVANVGAALFYLHGEAMATKERMKEMRKQAKIMAGVAAAARAQSRGETTITPNETLYTRAADSLEIKWKEAKRKHEIAKYIYEELLLAPWHITSEFFDYHTKGQGAAMMQLTGLGDPSGRREAFNFLREQDNKPAKNSVPVTGGGAENALAARIKKITGTDNDLRKLNMKQMAHILRSYGLEQKEIDTLKRWDRVHVIRDLSTRTASDGGGDGLGRFARGEKMKLNEQVQVYKERIQEIWRRQIQALSTDPGHETAAVATEAKTNAEETEEEIVEDESSSDEDEDEDDFADMLDVDEMGEKEASKWTEKSGGLYKAAADLNSMSERHKKDVELSTKDARDLANWRRQQEEEKAALQSGLNAGAGGSAAGGTGNRRLDNYYEGMKREVIRKKIVRTYPDGRQTVHFKFIVQPDEVERIMYEKREKSKKKTMENKKNRHLQKAEKINFREAADGVPVGHAYFEEDDDGYSGRQNAMVAAAGTSKHGRKLTLKINQNSRKQGGGLTNVPAMSKMKTLRRSGNPKIKFGTIMKKNMEHKKHKKRQREEEDAELYSTSVIRRGTSNRAERGAARDRKPHVILAQRFEKLRSAVDRRPHSGPFRRPVSKNLIPQYFDTIKHPIDLQTIRDKAARYDYASSAEFLADFELMRDNAIKFNGAAHGLAKEASEIYECVRTQIEGSADEFERMEEAVQKMHTMRPNKKKKVRAKGRGAKKGKKSFKRNNGGEREKISFQFGEDTESDNDNK